MLRSLLEEVGSVLEHVDLVALGIGVREILVLVRLLVVLDSGEAVRLGVALGGPLPRQLVRGRRIGGRSLIGRRRLVDGRQL